MLFPYQPILEVNQSAVKIQRENLKQFERDHFTQNDVHELIANRTAFCDDLLIDLWKHFRLEQHNELALIAVGGYGRKEMFPLSDLDFLILSEQPASVESEQKIAEFVQFLWDCGFDVGHSVRSIAQCEDEGRKDITIATNLLESRYLCGCQKTFQKLTALLQQPDFWPAQAFFNAKITEKNERYQRYNNTGYNLEPDIKYSPGGLRDLHLIYWIALRHSNSVSLQDILQSGFIYPEEYEQLYQSQYFLFKVRFALHLILKRYDNRLLFDRQLKVSELLGYEGQGNQGVEKMMKAFFQALQTISLLSNILSKHYYEHFLQQDHISECNALDENFVLINQTICLKNEYCFIEQPDTILDLFHHLTSLPQAEIHSVTLRKLLVSLNRPAGFLSQQPIAREKFIRLFSQPQAIKRAFVPMHQYGVLTAYLPQWKDIEGLMQFDLFHTYTVDEHTLRVMLKLESFLSPEAVEAHPICTEIFSHFFDRTLLYIAALFHDIAKGRGGDHAKLGVLDMLSFAEQHGFNRRETEIMAWLVEEHLLMSVTAQRRDIHDPEVVMNFAEAVKNHVRLDGLLCLTVADICATNETLWNSWKRSLLATLYQYTMQQFRQGMEKLLDNSEKIQANRSEALAILQAQSASVDINKINELWERCPEEYFLRNSPRQLVWHAELLTDLNTDLLVKISNRFSEGGTEIFVYCKDQPHLFHKVVCTIGAKKLSVHDAQIITTQDGYALDSFIVTELNGELLKFDRRRLLESALTQILQVHRIPTFSAISDKKLQHFQEPTKIRFLHLNKTEQTEMELFALDKAGLLAQVSQVFSKLNLNLLNAKITTIGARAEDFFILTNRQGKALNKTERTELEQLLHEVLTE